MFNGFLLECNGKLCSESTGFRPSGGPCGKLHEDGHRQTVQSYCSNAGDVKVDCTQAAYPDLDITEQRITIINTGESDLEISRIDSLCGLLPVDEYKLMYYTSDWGGEFEPVEVALEGTKILEVTAGRSSLGMHPWFSLAGKSGSIMTCSIAWSGNWIARLEPRPGGVYQVSAGLSNWQFARVLKPGQAMEGVHVVYSYLPCGTLSDTSARFGQWGKRVLCPRNALARSMPVEWNSWWPYEDAGLNEDVFKANVDICSGLGFDVCTLDAGWFGPPDENSDWFRLRGDWHRVNLRRFPSGIRALSDYTHAKGLKFGIWCEIEACGADSELANLHPELVAMRDGSPLGYVCMGSPEAVDWALGVLERLITEYRVDWIKLDFNLNPGAGCNRADHGHGSFDGLYAHYTGYYRLLDRVREKYPDVVLENCSSGGLRIDLGIMKHLHITFLSDPDYSEHGLQLAWGAATMLHPSACLHWAWSQTRETFKANRDNNPIKKDMPRSLFDYIIRNSMLTNFGCSYRLPDFPQWCLERLKYHVAFYKGTACHFIREATAYSLTGQPRRNGGGERWSSFLYVRDDGAALLFVFRLRGAGQKRTIRLAGLDNNRDYSLRFEDSKAVLNLSGAKLMETGLSISTMPEESSEIIHIVPS